MSTPTLARYQVLGRLATGGMAQVWLGRSMGFGGFEKLVVLKTILPNLMTNPQFVQMFINEARVAAMLNHPNCVQIFELGKEDDILYIAMEYIEGFSLSRVMKRAQQQGVKVPLAVIARIAADALSGLEYAHKLTDREGRPVGLIHRDVSPDNLLISFTGQTKLVDFGIAKASLTAGAATRAGTVKGKFGYIAPEYLRGQPIDGRADLFALGVVLYRAVTGKRPFVGPSEAAVSLAVLRDAPLWPSDMDPSLPQAMSAVLMMALEKAPDQRFTSAKAMRQAIENAVRPCEADEVGALLNRLWPPGDPERLALETLASGRAEESSEPLLESIVSTGIELPDGDEVLGTPLGAPSTADSDAGATPGALPVVTGVPLGPEPGSAGQGAPLLGREPPTAGASLLGPEPATVGAGGPGTLGGDSGSPVLGAEPKTSPTVAERPPTRARESLDEAPRRGGALKVVLALAVLCALAAGGYVALNGPPRFGFGGVKVAVTPPAAPAPAVAPAPAAAVAPLAPVAPAQAARGTVRVDVDLPLSVMLGEQELGKSPGAFELEVGPKKLVLKGAGVEQAFDVEVKANEVTAIAALRKGTLAVKAEPWAYVKIDGKSAGQTPLRRDLYEGTHAVELSNTELNVTRRMQVQIKAGETRAVTANLD